MAVNNTREKAPVAVLAAGGPITEDELRLLRQASEQAQFRVGVDSGTRHFVAIEIVPDYVTGDFDSLTEPERDQLAAQGATIVPTPDQDYTDLDKAIAFVRDSLGVTKFRVFAATAGRLDHTYSVLSTIIKYGRDLDIRLVDEVGETWLVRGSETLEGTDLPGRTVSYLALGEVRGITTTGVRWALNGEMLAPGVRDGTLNIITDEKVEIRAESGNLLVMLHHPGVR
ncbi:MAG: thiamine diphosphokinase [Armatimonadaceae bacterium]